MSPFVLVLWCAVQAPPPPPPPAKPPAAAGPAADTIVLRDGKKVEGKLVEYERFVEVQQQDNKKPRFPAWEVVRTDLAPEFIRVPEVVPFPTGLLGKVDYTLLSWKSTLLAVPKQPGYKLVAVDVSTANKVWELDKPLNLVQEPFLIQGVLYLITLDKDTDPEKRIKVKGNAVPKPVQKLTFRAIDVETCTNLWSEPFDNADRNKMVWEFMDAPKATLHVLPDRVMMRFVKEGWPVDAGVVDKEKPQRVATFVSFDPERKKISTTLESKDAGELGGKPFYLVPDTVILQIFRGGASSIFRLASVDLKNGKTKWEMPETDWITGKLYEVTDDSIFVSDPTHFFAILVKTGKKNDKWSVELGGGSLVDLDASHAYLYRKAKPPKLIQGIDLKTGKDAFRIEMGPTDEFTHVALVGHRLIYYDKAYHLHGFDTLAKKEIWKFVGLGKTIPGAPKRLGPGLSFYKDGLVTLLDPIEGKSIWESRGNYISIVQIGDEGILANKQIGSDLIRRRREPGKGGIYLTPAGTPMRFAMGIADDWSLPWVADGVAYCLSSGGRLVAADLKEKKILWQEQVSKTPLNPLSRPFARDGNLAVHLNGETHVFALSNRGRLYQVTHQPIRPDLQFEVAGTGLLATGRGQKLALFDYATGKRVWDSPAQGVHTYALAGEKLYAATTAALVQVDVKTGAVEETQPARGVTALAWDGKRLVAATGPYGFGFFAPPEEFKPAYRTREQSPAIAPKFRGWIAASGADVIYANADGEVTCFEGGAADKTAWSFKTPFYTSLLLVHEGKVWFAAHQLGLFGLDAKTGSIVWKRERTDAANYTPFLWEGKPVFWADEGWILAPE